MKKITAKNTDVQLAETAQENIFYSEIMVFPDIEQFATHCVANLTWTNIRMIMRLDNKAEREYYIKESAEQNWSSRLLERNIKTGYYLGIILCAEKDETIVKYSILNENKQLFASKYKTVLPTENELAEMISREKQKFINN